MPRARILTIALSLATILILLLGWRVFREPDFNQVPVNSLVDLLSDEMRARSWTAAPSASDGKPLPYALGWFVQKNRGYELLWHYGHGLESSSLIVKIPERRVTFVILANSDGLSRWRSLGDDADVSASPAATLFLNWYSSRQQL